MGGAGDAKTLRDQQVRADATGTASAAAQAGGGRTAAVGGGTDFTRTGGLVNLRRMIEHADPGEVDRVAAKWGSIHEALTSAQTELRAHTRAALTHWHGAAADGFASRAEELCRSLDNGAGYARNANTAMTTAAAGLRKAQQAMPKVPDGWDQFTRKLTSEAGDTQFNQDLATGMPRSKALAADGAQLSLMEERHQQAVVVMQDLEAQYHLATQIIGTRPMVRISTDRGVFPPAPTAHGVSADTRGAKAGLSHLRPLGDGKSTPNPASTLAEGSGRTSGTTILSSSINPLSVGASAVDFGCSANGIQDISSVPVRGLSGELAVAAPMQGVSTTAAIESPALGREAGDASAQKGGSRTYSTQIPSSSIIKAAGGERSRPMAAQDPNHMQISANPLPRGDGPVLGMESSRLLDANSGVSSNSVTGDDGGLASDRQISDGRAMGAARVIGDRGFLGLEAGLGSQAPGVPIGSIQAPYPAAGVSGVGGIQMRGQANAEMQQGVMPGVAPQLSRAARKRGKRRVRPEYLVEDQESWATGSHVNPASVID